jgi:serine/threonine protein kinase
MSKLIGRTLGQYQIIEQIGQGGMATVFKAYQPNLDRHVALKVLLHFPSEQPDFGERFRREARIIAGLTHPHILPVYDFGQDGEYSFLAMRYVDGAHTLKQDMAGSPALGRVAELIGQIAGALDAAHQKGIIHRDVKPSNVLMDGDWTLLADFGLARIMEDAVKLTGTGVGIGTPAYMSPEQGQGDTVDHHTDIYSLGIILFEMLTGQIPNDAETPFGIILKRLTEPLPLPRSLNPDIPKAVERVILKALAREPDNRFASAGALAAALEAAIGPSALQAILPAEMVPPSVSLLETAKLAISPVSQPDTVQDQRNRGVLLKRVSDFWVKGVLEHSLHGAAFIELGLESRPEAVDHLWEMVLQSQELAQLPIPSSTKIVDVFREMDQSLLILGEPGSGKTTLLLELARDLIGRAEQDPTQPIPVAFNLSSWAQSQPPMDEWLVAELNARYIIPKRIARDWVQNDALLLLLDGLDEVTLASREACVQALNAFRGEHLVSMAVCSRVADYEALTSRLKLQGAVVLQGLSDPQVEAYLTRAGPELSALRTALQQDHALQELARSPLMLSMMTLAYRGLPAEALTSADSTADRLRHLFDTYIRQMFTRRGGEQPYTPEQTRHWLARLASGMLKHNQAIFMLEQLQPSWLPSRRLRLVYLQTLSVIVLAVVFGLPLGMIAVWLWNLAGPRGFHEIVSSIISRPNWSLWVCFGIPLLIFIRFLAKRGKVPHDESMSMENVMYKIQPVETVRWSWRRGVAKTKENWRKRRYRLLVGGLILAAA